jgi:hypothetical protein
MPTAGIEHGIPESERPQTHTFDSPAIKIGTNFVYSVQNSSYIAVRPIVTVPVWKSEVVSYNVGRARVIKPWLISVS